MTSHIDHKQQSGNPETPDEILFRHLRTMYLRNPEIGAWEVRKHSVIAPIEDYLLAHGQFFKEPSRETLSQSGLISGSGRAFPATPGNCYHNAMWAAYLDAKLTYVEGVAIHPMRPEPVPHAWVVTKDGNVIDDTWAQSGMSYFGVSIDGLLLMELVVHTNGNHLAKFPSVLFTVGIDTLQRSQAAPSRWRTKWSHYNASDCANGDYFMLRTNCFAECLLILAENEWTGRATDLAGKIREIATEAGRTKEAIEALPKSPQAHLAALKRLKSWIDRMGIVVTKNPRKGWQLRLERLSPTQ